MLMRRMVTIAVVALACTSQSACTVELGSVGGNASAPRSDSGPNGTQPRTSDGQWPATGPLFSGPAADLGDHFCTASVIDSAARDVVMTAAHCVASGDGTPPRTGMSFVPGYHDHVAPFGVWTVTRAVVDDVWQASADPAHDVAFLVVDQDGAGSIEDVTGGYQLVTDPGPANQVDAIGYPDSADAPAVRSGTTSQISPTQLKLAALGLYDGVSGGPWVRDGDQVIAVTGGYEEGGVTPEVSYASYLDDSAQRLLADLADPNPGAGTGTGLDDHVGSPPSS